MNPSNASSQNDLKDVYLCYNSADSDWVVKLAEQLESETIDGLPTSRRLRVFLDKWDIDSGESLIQRMNEGMKNSRYVVTVLSPEFMKAPWPTFEWTHIVTLDPMNAQKRLIPLLCRDVSRDGKERLDLCAPFRGLKHIDFRYDDGFAREFRSLVRRIRGQPRERGTIRSPLAGVFPVIALNDSEESWQPDKVEEILLSNLLPVEAMPAQIWSAETEARKKSDVLSLIKNPPGFILKEGRLYTFENLKSTTALPSQLFWQSTLTGQGGTQDQASIAWNILTALYYKAGNRPWHLQTLAENTCYVGVSFYRESPYANANMQSSLAQVFGAGEGLVLKGQRALIDKKLDSKAHLDSHGAEQLLRKAIELYTAQHKQPPKRVVLHKTSRFWRDELLGFQKGLGDVPFYDFLTLETLDTRFMRVGKEPPLRGSVVMLGARNYLLYTVGYVPYFRIYPGFRIPRPLEIVEHYGHSPAHDVCREILALTKLNWNSCAFGSSLPITLRFARDVGKILAELPSGITPPTKYKFYM